MNEKQESLLKHTVRAPNDDPLRQVMLMHTSPLPRVTANRRVGRPKSLWAHECYKRIWMKQGLGSELQFNSNKDACVTSMAANIYAHVYGFYG